MAGLQAEAGEGSSCSAFGDQLTQPQPCAIKKPALQSRKAHPGCSQAQRNKPQTGLLVAPNGLPRARRGQYLTLACTSFGQHHSHIQRENQASKCRHLLRQIPLHASSFFLSFFPFAQLTIFCLFLQFFLYFLFQISCFNLPFAYSILPSSTLLFFKYILLIMHLQLSHFLPFTRLHSVHSLPPTSHTYSSCPWVILISSLASTFPILFLPSRLFSTYHLCYLFSVPFPRLSPFHSPVDNPPCELHFCGSVPLLVVCLVCFCFCFRCGC